MMLLFKKVRKRHWTKRKLLSHSMRLQRILTMIWPKALILRLVVNHWTEWSNDFETQFLEKNLLEINLSCFNNLSLTSPFLNSHVEQISILFIANSFWSLVGLIFTLNAPKILGMSITISINSYLCIIKYYALYFFILSQSHLNHRRTCSCDV